MKKSKLSLSLVPNSGDAATIPKLASIQSLASPFAWYPTVLMPFPFLKNSINNLPASFREFSFSPDFSIDLGYLRIVKVKPPVKNPIRVHRVQKQIPISVKIEGHFDILTEIGNKVSDSSGFRFRKSKRPPVILSTGVVT